MSPPSTSSFCLPLSLDKDIHGHMEIPQQLWVEAEKKKKQSKQANKQTKTVGGTPCCLHQPIPAVLDMNQECGVVPAASGH